MFTGLIETTGRIVQKERISRNMLLSVEPEKTGFLDDVKKGSSLSVNGVCLTVTEKNKRSFQAFLSSETFQITNLKETNARDMVNLEKAMRLKDRLDGHLVSGHVDATALVTGILKQGRDYLLTLRIPPDLIKYTIPKGSLAVNGISLTIARKRSDLVFFSIIPETCRNTNIPLLKAGHKVNIEIDMVAKYLWNFLKAR